MTDRGQALRRRRHLDHQVFAIDGFPETLRLGDRRLGVVGEIRRDLEADETVRAMEPIVDRTQHVGGVLDVLDRQLLVEIGD